MKSKIRSKTTAVGQKQWLILGLVVLLVIILVWIYAQKQVSVGKAVYFRCAVWSEGDINLSLSPGSLNITSLPEEPLSLRILTKNSSEREENYTFILDRLGSSTFKITIIQSTAAIAEDILYTGGDDLTTIYLDTNDTRADLEVSHHAGQIRVRNLHFIVPPSPLAPPPVPPSLAHRFFGQVNGLPEGSFVLRAKVSGTLLGSTSLDEDGLFNFTVTTSGPPFVVFFVANASLETRVGAARYNPGSTTELGFQYVAPAPTAPQVTPPSTTPPATTTNQTTVNQTTTTTNQTAANRTANRTTGNCTQNWDCGEWSLCRNSQQTRVCYRIDNCDQQLAQGRIAEIAIMPKPAEQRTCQETVPPTPATLCSSNSKRCLGAELQQCAADGSAWITSTTCPNGCSSLTLECKSEPAVPPVQQQPSSTWIYYLLGSLVLLAVIAIVVILLVGQKKYAPAKEYIEEGRESGMSDQQIRTRLVSQGWDAAKVDKLLHK